jgi:2-amino-4-hydroxy-6-hydroxymethyldihydropteridine diphosphokinase
MADQQATVRSFIALGSNLGDRLANLRDGAATLRSHAGIYRLEASPVYETVALTKAESEIQPAYFNAVLGLETTLDPLDLLDLCLEIERERGRVRAEPHDWQPRTLDLDMLAYGALSRITETLTVPHPRIAERRFVLEPWNDLAGAFWVPAPFEKTVGALLRDAPAGEAPVRTKHRLLD